MSTTATKISLYNLHFAVFFLYFHQIAYTKSYILQLFCSDIFMQNPAAGCNIRRIIAAIMEASSWPSRDRVVGHITARLLITRVWDHHSQWDIRGDLFMEYIQGSST